MKHQLPWYNILDITNGNWYLDPISRVTVQNTHRSFRKHYLLSDCFVLIKVLLKFSLLCTLPSMYITKHSTVHIKAFIGHVHDYRVRTALITDKMTVSVPGIVVLCTSGLGTSQFCVFQTVNSECNLKSVIHAWFLFSTRAGYCNWHIRLLTIYLFLIADTISDAWVFTPRFFLCGLLLYLHKSWRLFDGFFFLIAKVHTHIEIWYVFLILKILQYVPGNWKFYIVDLKTEMKKHSDPKHYIKVTSYGNTRDSFSSQVWVMQKLKSSSQTIDR